MAGSLTGHPNESRVALATSRSGETIVTAGRTRVVYRESRRTNSITVVKTSSSGSWIFRMFE
jgi:P pilus assembly chaperone PapD